MKSEEKTYCKLCLNEKPLMDSHILPSFVFKWLKNTSATGYLRNTETPNLRKQDGWKKKLLCSDCESLFNNYETQFSKVIFHPYTSTELDKDGIAQGIQKYYKYDNWLLKFIISIHWRAIVCSEIKKDDLGEKLFDKRVEQTEIWRQFLIGERNNTGANESYIIFLQNLASGEGTLPNTINDRVNHYLLRSVDYTTVFSKNKLGFYFKLGPIAFLTTVVPSTMKLVSDIKVRMKGNIKTAQVLNNTDIANFIFITRPNEFSERYKISPNQNAKIDETIRNNPDRLVNSLTLGAIQGDMILKNKKGKNK